MLNGGPLGFLKRAGFRVFADAPQVSRDVWLRPLDSDWFFDVHY